MTASHIDLGQVADFDLGNLRVCPSRCQVSGNGETRTLEPRVMQVLVALAAARPDVVSRDQLAQTCWKGVNVGDDAISRCILALRHLAKAFSPEPFSIETVPRVGYALVERSAPVNGWSWSKLSVSRTAIFALVALVVAAVAVLAFVKLTPARVEPATIAVLPFRNLSAGDRYFAEGVGEEILARLAREPQFRVAARSASARFSSDPDLRSLGHELGVDYVIEGSVRNENKQVRVNASLVRTSDGVQIWSDSYAGGIDDVFGIQNQIGEAVAASLRRRLLRAPTIAGATVTNGEAYSLYLTARGLIRTRNRRVAETAADLLRDSLKLDPHYAPAWASLAHTMRRDGPLDPLDSGHEQLIAELPIAERYARRALQLAPDLAEAHGTLGMLLGFASPEAQMYIRRAAQLEPNDPEIMVWLGVAHRAAGEFDEELAAYRRAAELDPLWARPIRETAVALAERGDRRAAEMVARQGHRSDTITQHMLLARIAAIFGDFSEAVRRWSIVVRSNSPRWGLPAQESLSAVRFVADLGGEPPPLAAPPPGPRATTRIWMEQPPNPETWRLRNRSTIAAFVYQDENHVAAKLMLNAGRFKELAAVYRTPSGLLGLRPDRPVRADQLDEVPLVAIALRRTGQDAHADRLLQQASERLAAIDRRGRAPFWFDVDAAALWAVQGKKREALNRLERATQRGWRHVGVVDLPQLGDEPAFASLHGELRFRRIQERLAVHREREKQELLSLDN